MYVVYCRMLALREHKAASRLLVLGLILVLVLRRARAHTWAHALVDLQGLFTLQLSNREAWT
jgi:hypothetical protein